MDDIKLCRRLFFVVFLSTLIVSESFVNSGERGIVPTLFPRSSRLSISTPNQPISTSVDSERSTALEPSGGLKRFYIETHGCTSNLADSDVVRAVLLKAGYESTVELEDAHLILTNTCSIRENAESKMFQRLKYFASLRKKSRKESIGRSSDLGRYPMIGVLGCMAERLKESLLEDYDVDFICGPDEYKYVCCVVINDGPTYPHFFPTQSRLDTHCYPSFLIWLLLIGRFRI